MTNYISVFSDFFNKDDVKSITTTQNTDGTYNLTINFYHNDPEKTKYVYPNLSKHLLTRTVIDLRNQLL